MFASTAACAPSGDLAITDNASAALATTSELPSLRRDQHLPQRRIISTRRKRDTSHLQGLILRTASVVPLDRPSHPRSLHVHIRTSALGDSSSSATELKMFASTAACALSGDFAMTDNAPAALATTSRLLSLRRYQHLLQRRIISTRRKRDTSRL
jgi:hypothetical protein